MEWMGQLQSHHAYRKHQLALSSSSGGKQHQRSPSDGRVVAAPSSLFTGTGQPETVE